MLTPYGSWQSPITTDLIVAETIGVGGGRQVGEYLYWQETRPREGGRTVVVRKDRDGTNRDFNPPPWNARSRVHEYGGDAWLIDRDTLIFANFADQQLYQQSFGESPHKLTDSPMLRFANGVVDRQRNRLICVVEDHGATGSEPENLLAAVDLDSGAVTRLATGHDFYSSPTLTADASELAFITWDHPNMPWDGTRLWVAAIGADGTLNKPQYIAGNEHEAIQQPRFSSDGELYFISDRDGWWNLFQGRVQPRPVRPMQAEFGVAPWSFGAQTYVILKPGEIICVYSEQNRRQLAHLDVNTGTLAPVDTPFTDIGSISLSGQILTFTGASPTGFAAIVNLNLQDGSITPVKRSCEVSLDSGYLSVPEAIEFPTADGDVAHGLYYPPANKDFAAPTAERPPLIVILHGGPTGSTDTTLSLARQFWTSRGFALFDVNYRGSTGYGREYRNKLNGRWGIVDVEDTVHGARFLVEKGLADPARLAIRGGSAGGYTVLAALTFTDTFRAGASHYGIADLSALAQDTHKFESRYLDSLVGRYPDDIAVYDARSPLRHVDQLRCPVIFFQGLEDKVVPPNQAELMVAALKAKGIPVAYVPFAGEQHGFRKAENIKRSLDLELYFYARVFGFSPADHIDPVEITHLDPP